MKEILLDMSLLNFSSFSFSQDNDQGVVSHLPRDYAVAKKIGLILGVSLLQHVIINIFIQPSYLPKKICFMLFCTHISKAAQNCPFPIYFWTRTIFLRIYNIS